MNTNIRFEEKSYEIVVVGGGMSGICASLGQAAGTAIAEAKKSGCNVHTVDIQAVRKKLKENGAAI